MGDIATFRVVRSAQHPRPGDDAVYRPLAKAGAGAGVPVAPEKQPEKQAAKPPPNQGPKQPVTRAPEHGDDRRAAARAVLDDPPPQDAAAAYAELRALDEWLVSVANRPDPGELAARAERVASAAGGEGPVGERGGAWLSLKTYLAERVVAAAVLASPAGRGAQAAAEAVEAAAMSARALRLLLVGGLCEAVQRPDAPATPAAAYALLADRAVALPESLMSVLRVRTPRDALARRPGFADLYVLRSEWSRYVPGEVAHVENVMAGELKQRVHERLDETELTRTEDTSSRTMDERSTQSTDRFTLESEASRQTSMRIGVDGSVDTSGQYGPTRVTTHLAGSFDYSVEEARRLATTQAREVVARAVSSIERQVREVRTTRDLRRITETNTHRLDAVGRSAHVVGVYRWVDKIERVQVFRYPHRFLLEFQVPEPAAFLLWARTAAPPEGPEPPTPFTHDGDAHGRPLSVSDVSPDTYATLAARYGADVPPPPERRKTVVAAVALDVEPPNYLERGTGDIDVRMGPVASKTIEVAVPDGYVTRSVAAAASATPALARWGDVEGGPNPIASDSSYGFRWGYHYQRVDVVVGGVEIRLEDPARHTVEFEPRAFAAGWLTRSATRTLAGASGSVTASVTAAGSFRTAVSLEFSCEVTQEALNRWAAEVYARIRAAYVDRVNEHRDAAGEAFAPAPWQDDGASAQANRRTVVDELKRQVVTMLLGEPFDGLPAVVPHAEGGPRVDVDAALAAAPYVQFLEQAFEWENVTYTLYPYYWGPRSSWAEALARESTDPEMAAFLRAGSARVVVPARPSMETALATFLDFGILWGGGPAPTVDEAGYLSVADEIRSLRGAPDEGEPGESWEARLPTTLVWLDPSPDLPRNPEPRLPASATRAGG
ncbi:MAG TPA: hypothetical protein VF519_12510 [Mycobacteriales bacterium]|jgi:hypothetical protein